MSENCVLEYASDDSEEQDKARQVNEELFEGAQ